MTLKLCLYVSVVNSYLIRTQVKTAIKPRKERTDMPDNRISAELSQADQQDILVAIKAIRENLPFLIDLTPEERSSLPTTGDKRRGF